MMPVFAGLCASCRHMRPVSSRKGTVFRLCLLSREDPSFPRYPTLPVLRCSGYAERDPGKDDAPPPEGGGSDGSTEAGGSGSVREEASDPEPEARRGDSEEGATVSRSGFGWTSWLATFVPAPARPGPSAGVSAVTSAYPAAFVSAYALESALVPRSPRSR